jgi:hypothetical protein
MVKPSVGTWMKPMRKKIIPAVSVGVSGSGVLLPRAF